MRLTVHDSELAHHPYQNGGLVSATPSGEIHKFWDGADGTMPTLDQLERLAACWNACAGIPTEALRYESLDSTRDILDRLVYVIECEREAGILDPTIMPEAVERAKDVLGMRGGRPTPAAPSASAPAQSEAGQE